MRCRAVSRRSGQQDDHRQAGRRGRSRPHRDPHGHGLDRHRMAAEGSSMARACRHRQGGPHPRTGRQNHDRDGLLSAQHGVDGRALQRGRRSHWGVENRLHWRLDVVMNEDQDRTRLDNGPHNLAVLRHMALNVNAEGHNKRDPCAASSSEPAGIDAYLARLLALF